MEMRHGPLLHRGCVKHKIEGGPFQDFVDLPQQGARRPGETFDHRCGRFLEMRVMITR